MEEEPEFDNIKTAKKVCQVLKDGGHECYLVGGSVRDFLMGVEPHDIDLATNAQPDVMVKLFQDAKHKVIPTGIKHGTVTVVFGTTPIEITTYRVEADYDEKRRPSAVAFVRDIKQDLIRRDFTINALAYDPTTAEIIDIVGGKHDLKEQVIRAVGSPDDRFFEDPLRMFRAFRFAAKLGFTIERATYQSIKTNAKRTESLSAERVRDELLKLLSAPKPSNSLRMMHETGVMEVWLPEVSSLFGIKQNPAIHTYDVFEHTLAVVDAIFPRPLLRLAALLHDTGKKVATKVEADGELHNYNHEDVSAEIAKTVCARLKMSNEDSRYVISVAQNHMVNYVHRWSDGAVRRWVRKVGPDMVDDMIEFVRADHAGGIRLVCPDFSQELAARIDAINAKEFIVPLAITGHDIIEKTGLKGPAIGIVKTYLEEIITDTPERNTKEILLAEMEAFLASKPYLHPPCHRRKRG